VVWISDDEGDNWQPRYEDFKGASSSGTSSTDDFQSFVENQLLELGQYDGEEDTSQWNWERTWADDQWQEQDMTLRENTDNFTGPTPGPTGPPCGIPNSALEYFLRYWPPEVISRIIVETNRLAYYIFLFAITFFRGGEGALFSFPHVVLWIVHVPITLT
jgi:hypothetical protein